MEQVGVQFIAQGGDQYITTLHNATNSTNTFVDATEKGGGRVGAAGQVMIGALRQVGTMAVEAFAQAAKATAAFVGESISVAGDFEAGMKKFQAVAGKGVDTAGLEKFKDLFISLGKELPVSTSEVEQAAIEMVSGGIDPAIVAGGALRQTIQFAAASGLSLADAAKTSAKFLAGWTDSAATTEQKIAFLTLSTDTLTKAAAASSTTASELRLGLFNVQGAAQALGVSFEDTTATLALLAPSFESSASAGTALNVFMTRLVPQTDKAVAVMKDLGLMTEANQNLFFDTQGNFKGMANAAELLKEKLGGLTAERKVDYLHQLFGNDALKVGNFLLADGAAAIDAMKNKMAEANGVSDTAALMQSGYNTALENAKGSVEALQIRIGSFLLPVLTDLLNNAIAPGINAITSFAESFFKMVPAIMASDDPLQSFLNALKVAAPQFLDTISGIEDFKDAVIGFATPILDVAIPAFQELAQGIGTLQQYIAAVVEDGDYLNDFLTDLPKPMQGVVQAAGEVVALFRSTNEEGSQLGSMLNDLNGIWNLALKTVQDVGAGYMAIANAVLPIIQNLWKEHGTEISAFLKTTYDTVISIVRLALQLYDAIVPPILNTIAGFFRDHGSEIEKILSGAGQAIGAIVSGTMETIKGIFQLALDLIHGDWKVAWGDIEGIVTAQAKAIGGVITGFLNIIAGLFDTSLADIGKTWSDNWNSMVDLVGKIGWWEAGKAVVLGIKQGVDDAWNGMINWLSNKMSGLVDAAMDAIGAHSPATEFMPVGAYAIQGIMQGMQGVIPSLNDLINQTGNEMIAALTKNIEEGGDKIRKELEKLTSDIKDIASQINEAIGDAFGATASVDRQLAKNLEDVQKISPELQAMTRYRLNAARQEAATIADPVESARFYQQRSKQIMELANLQTRINNAQQSVNDTMTAQADEMAKSDEKRALIAGDLTNEQRAALEEQLSATEDLVAADTIRAQLAADLTDKQREAVDQQLIASGLAQDAQITARQAAMTQIEVLQQQLALISAAQGAESSQSAAYAANNVNPVNAIADQIAAIFSGSDVASKLPGILESTLVSQVFGLLDQLRNASASPAASAAQIGTNSGYQSFSQTRTYNMPIYTNQSPDALAQSLAIQQAVMP